MMQLVRCGWRAAATSMNGGVCSSSSVPALQAVAQPRRATTALHAAAVEQDGLMDGPRSVFTQYTVYKGKAAMAAKPIRPTWTTVNGSKGPFDQVKRSGSLMLEFANVAPNQGAQSNFGSRNYDWANKMMFSLSVTELGQLVDMPPTGTMELFHDPDKNTDKEGTRGKKFKISPAPSQDGTMYFSLSGRSATGGQNSVSVPVSSAEFNVLRTTASFLIPRLLGFDEAVLPGPQPQAGP